MAFSHRRALREFYNQALLNPALLCLNCSHTAWNRAACRCTEEKRNDCLLFAGEMQIELAAHRPAAWVNEAPRLMAES